MDLLKINIGIVECDSHAICEAHYANMPEAERPPQHEIHDTLERINGKTFFRCQIQLGEKNAQFESPSADAENRTHLLFETIEQAWVKIRGEISPAPETPIIVLPG